MSSIDMGGEPSAEVPLVRGLDGKLEPGSATERPVPRVYEHVSEPTPASTWHAASGAPITDRLLEWPPDVFALTNVVLARAEAFRFALSVKDWPPRRFGDWARRSRRRAAAGARGRRTVPAPCPTWSPQNGKSFARARTCPSRKSNSDEPTDCARRC